MISRTLGTELPRSKLSCLPVCGLSLRRSEMGSYWVLYRYGRDWIHDGERGDEMAQAHPRIGWDCLAPGEEEVEGPDARQPSRQRKRRALEDRDTARAHTYTHPQPPHGWTDVYLHPVYVLDVFPSSSGWKVSSSIRMDEFEFRSGWIVSILSSSS